MLMLFAGHETTNLLGNAILDANQINGAALLKVGLDRKCRRGILRLRPVL